MVFEQRSDIATLVLAIAHSPIVARRAAPANALAWDDMGLELPEGFDDGDIAVLRWIAEEARRAGRGLFKH
jgi:hypothetical protein